ncbi:hypothetical protein RB195_026568 [Necator americanus]|uniref:Ground-like domain-containing protein n=1 Tax=Necator americanus TaxID=51031 RepID=A0ABR1EXI2_NECAM
MRLICAAKTWTDTARHMHLPHKRNEYFIVEDIFCSKIAKFKHSIRKGKFDKLLYIDKNQSGYNDNLYMQRQRVRKKREINLVRGGGGKRPGIESDHGHCNSFEISELVRKHIATNPSLAAVKSAIYQELVSLYPDGYFTVMCVDGAVSYQADSHRYCVEGNMDHNCYVFMM